MASPKDQCIQNPYHDLVRPRSSNYFCSRLPTEAKHLPMESKSLYTYAESSGTLSLLLSLDVEKALDRVHWFYLQGVLQKCGSNGFILKAILALYSTPSAQVFSADMLSQKFHITNGTRQGCPLSPLIFNMMMEPLAEHIKQNPLISGFTIGQTSHKINLFVNDVILMIIKLVPSLAEVQQTLQSFSNVSYYKVNTNKSYILDLGIDATTKNFLQAKYSYAWAETDITYLGVQLMRSTKNLFTANFKPLLTKLQSNTQQLAKHELTWLGRLESFKMLHLPLLYKFRTIPIPIPLSYFISLQTMLNKFLWKGKKPRCAHTTKTSRRSRNHWFWGLLPSTSNYPITRLV